MENIEASIRDISDDQLDRAIGGVNERYRELDRERDRRLREQKIFMERSRQISLGYTPEKDREKGSLALFELAISYAEAGAPWTKTAALIRAGEEVLDYELGEFEGKCTCDENHAEPSSDTENEAPVPFGKALEKLINQYSLDSEYGTPDFILTQYILDSLLAYQRLRSN